MLAGSGRRIAQRLFSPLLRGNVARSAARAALLVAVVMSPRMAIPTSAFAQETQTVVIGSTLQPADLAIAVGTTVRWENQHSERHRMRSNTGPVEFDSGNLDPGGSYSFTFSTAGTYQYRDERDASLSNYWGSITVTDTGGENGDGGGDGGDGGGSPPPSTPTVRMANRVFSPGSLTVAEGGTVTFLNDDGRDHTVTARDSAYDSGIMGSGASFAKTYTLAGTYSYFCAIHPDMVGTVQVTNAAGNVPDPTPEPDAGAGGGGGAAPPAGDIQIIDFGYGPGALSVDVGQTVVWANAGAALHTVTARNGAFDSGLISAGGTYARQFATVATIEYFCTLHPNMSGSIVVGGEPGAPPPPPEPVPDLPPLPAGDLEIVDFSFAPGTIEVAAGTTLTWVNAGVAPHTVTSRSGIFDSGIMERGITYTRTFEEPGTYPYFCALHPDMTASVIVPGESGSAPPPAPPPPRLPAPIAGDVEVLDFSFAPLTIEVAPGTTLTWVNGGVAPHTVTARSGAFDSGFMNTGDEFQRTLGEPGVIEYFCTLHPNMVGTVIVSGDAPARPSAGNQTGDGASASGSAGAADGGAIDSPADGGGDATGSSAAVASAADADIVMLDFDYSPGSISIPVGTTLSWYNAGAALHTATARDGYFDSGFAAQGESYSHTFGTVGAFEYFCVIHPQMVATIEVTDATGGGDADPTAVAEASLAVIEDAEQVAETAIAEFSYTPTTLSIAVDSAVLWTNEGLAGHSVTAVDGSFDSGVIRTGQSFARLFTEAGSFAYVCTVYPGMGGTVLVQDESPASDDSGVPGGLPVLAALVAGAFALGIGGAYLVLGRRPR
jgi:plastocyanin